MDKKKKEKDGEGVFHADSMAIENDPFFLNGLDDIGEKVFSPEYKAMIKRLKKENADKETT